ncbi:Re/Si-specific NAD(P)(+) transhydrogenase subunit alpha [candidate division KSB1 bacterium]|nr:Re/Si-specific NAD(P)(+) transhydrogenase subunit alpha [candidate division KSB1 bacterium]
MKIGIPNERFNNETRVALIPAAIANLKNEHHEVYIESDAGIGSYIPNEEYEKAGATLVSDTKKLYESVDVIFKVSPPTQNLTLKQHEVNLMREGIIYIGFLAPHSNRDVLEKMQDRKITVFAMEYVPRITRAQSMDALSSMATLAGYKAVLLGANHLGKIFPLLMTAAGSITPANVFVLGAGVAGLQAIATAKRLGARVEAFDPRAAVKEQIESLGAKFVEMELPKEDVETAGGYAKEQTDEFLKKEQEAIARRLSRTDVIISTAQIFGKKAPILITEEMVAQMKPGSVIVDLAAEQGGNCELTQANEVVNKHSVTIVGAVNLPASIPFHASQMYAKNISNLFRHLFQSPDFKLDFDDEITRSACIIRNGEIVNEMVKQLV